MTKYRELANEFFEKRRKTTKWYPVVSGLLGAFAAAILVNVVGEPTWVSYAYTCVVGIAFVAAWIKARRVYVAAMNAHERLMDYVLGGRKSSERRRT